MTYPLWATPERQAALVELFARCGGFCIYGHRPCHNPAHHYENYIEDIIKDWVADDNARRAAEWRREQQLLHHLPDERGWRRQRFDPVAREQFLSQRPEFYLEATGISGLTFTRVAKVRIPGTHMRLFADIPRTKGMSAHKRRKIRRQLGLAVEENRAIEQICQQAAKDFWTSI
jgi:hypothetical protein